MHAWQVRKADGLLRTPDNAAYPFARGSGLCGFERLPAVQAISRRGGHAWIRTGIADGVREAASLSSRRATIVPSG